MATNTDWSKFQRRHLHTLLKIQVQIGKGASSVLDDSIEALISEMEPEDVDRVTTNITA